MIPCPRCKQTASASSRSPAEAPLGGMSVAHGSLLVARCLVARTPTGTGIGDTAARLEASLCLLQIDGLRRRHISDVQGRHELHTRLHGGSSPSSLCSGIRFRFERNVWLLSASYLRPYRALASYDIAQSSERSEGIGGVEQAILRDTGVTELWIPAGPGSLMTPHPHSLQTPKSSKER